MALNNVISQATRLISTLLFQQTQPRCKQPSKALKHIVRLDGQVQFKRSNLGLAPLQAGVDISVLKRSPAPF